MGRSLNLGWLKQSPGGRMGVREGLGTAWASARMWHLQGSSSTSWSTLAPSTLQYFGAGGQKQQL